jgi:2-keto-3-deoxy-L-rhamnonate aldolase RhmA
VRSNPALRRLRAGETVLGMFAIDFYSTGLARTAASAGAEFVVLDQEHTGWGLDQIRSLLAAARAADTVPLVRVRTLDVHAIGSVLAFGALGVMVPLIRDADEARVVAAAAKYPPEGERGFGILYVDEHEGDVAGYMRAANDELMVIAMVETVGALDDVEAIAATEGIDVLWIGHFDLTASMGIAGQFGHPRYRQALAAVVDASERHGKAAGISSDDADHAVELARAGFRFIAVGHDIVLLRDALQQRLAAVRAALLQPVEAAR